MPNISPTHPRPTKYVGVATQQMLRLHYFGKVFIVILNLLSSLVFVLSP